MSSIFRILLFALISLPWLSLCTIAQNKTTVTQDANNIQGSVTDGVYKNPFFGIEITLPGSWNSLGGEDSDTARNMTAEALKSKNSSANEAIDRATDVNRLLFFYAKEPLGAIDNASIALAVARQPSKFVTAKMVMEATKSAVLKNPDTKLISDAQDQTVGGRQFITMELELALGTKRTPIKYFVTMIKGYSFTFSLSAFDKESWDILEKSIQSIKFTSNN